VYIEPELLSAGTYEIILHPNYKV